MGLHTSMQVPWRLGALGPQELEQPALWATYLLGPNTGLHWKQYKFLTNKRSPIFKNCLILMNRIIVFFSLCWSSHANEHRLPFQNLSLWWQSPWSIDVINQDLKPYFTRGDVIYLQTPSINHKEDLNKSTIFILLRIFSGKVYFIFEHHFQWV